MAWWLSGGAVCSGAAVGAWQIYRSARAVSLMSVDMAGRKQQQQPRWLARSPTSPLGEPPPHPIVTPVKPLKRNYNCNPFQANAR